MSLSQINPNQLRPPGDDGLGPIIHVPPARHSEAIERLVSVGGQVDREHARRFLEYAREHQVNLQGLWARLDRHGRIEMTVLGVPSPGRTAMVFATHPIGETQVAALGGLIDHACIGLGSMNVNLAQALLDPGQSIDRSAFLAGGFFDLATLSYLERPLRQSRGKAIAAWPSGMSLLSYSQELRSTLLDVLGRSYEETLDCPGLRGYRRTEDILEGHCASGLFDPSLWTLLLIDGQASGAALMNPAADHNSIELVYLGLVKSARGRGLGQQLLRHAIALLEHRRERTIHLAVDEANAPAISLYRREGFRPVQRRRALIRPLRAEPATSSVNSTS